jgi:hypothetical protein
VVATLTLASMAAASLHRPILRMTGRILVAGDGLRPVDVIVVAIDADGAGVLEASDLFHDGLAARVAVFADPPDRADLEFIRRGVPYDDEAARSLRELRALGVESLEQIPRAVTGTEDEGRVLPDWCRERRFGSVIVVTRADHSRRLRRVLRRSMEGRETTVIVRPARHSQFDPERWWESREGTRILIVELEKLLLDVARHPIS